jgi:hypothetical protein
VIKKSFDFLDKNKEVKKVLVDIYSRDLDKTLINDVTEIHTVVLYKPTSSKKIFVIDPNNAKFSSHLSNKKWLDLEYFTNKEIISSYKKEIYKSCTDETDQTLQTGRDCIDIAVKLAFAICKETNSFESIDKVLNSDAIYTIANLKSAYKALPEYVEKTPLCKKQSSDVYLSNKVTACITLLAAKYKNFIQTTKKLYKDVFKSKSIFENIDNEYEAVFSKLSDNNQDSIEGFISSTYEPFCEKLSSQYIESQILGNVSEN